MSAPLTVVSTSRPPVADVEYPLSVSTTKMMYYAEKLNPDLYSKIGADQWPSLKPASGSGCFQTTSSWSPDIVKMLGGYAGIRGFLYVPAFDQKNAPPSASLAVCEDYDQGFLPGSIVEPYDNSGYHFIVAVGKQYQLYFAFMGSEGQLLENALSFGFDDHLSAYIKALGGIRLETVKTGLPTKDKPFYNHPICIHDYKSSVPEIISYSGGAIGKTVKIDGHTYEVVCTELAKTEEEEEEIEPEIPMFYVQELQECYFLVEMNKKKDRINTLNISVSELDARLDKEQEEREAKSESKKRKGPETDPAESQFKANGKKPKQFDEIGPKRLSLKKCDFFDFDPEITKFMSLGKGATSSPTETTALSLPVIVDQVMNDRTPSPPAEINEIVRRLRNVDAEV